VEVYRTKGADTRNGAVITDTTCDEDLMEFGYLIQVAVEFLNR